MATIFSIKFSGHFQLKSYTIANIATQTRTIHSCHACIGRNTGKMRCITVHRTTSLNLVSVNFKTVMKRPICLNSILKQKNGKKNHSALATKASINSPPTNQIFSVSKVLPNQQE